MPRVRGKRTRRRARLRAARTQRRPRPSRILPRRPDSARLGPARRTAGSGAEHKSHESCELFNACALRSHTSTIASERGTSSLDPRRRMSHRLRESSRGAEHTPQNMLCAHRSVPSRASWGNESSTSWGRWLCVLRAATLPATANCAQHPTDALPSALVGHRQEGSSLLASPIGHARCLGSAGRVSRAGRVRTVDGALVIRRLVDFGRSTSPNDQAREHLNRGNRKMPCWDPRMHAMPRRPSLADVHLEGGSLQREPCLTYNFRGNGLTRRKYCGFGMRSEFTLTWVGQNLH